MKYIYILMITITSCFASGCVQKQELVKNSQFESGETWMLGKDAEIKDGVCLMTLSIPRYRNSWNQMCEQIVAVKPNTTYTITAKACMSLYPASNGLYIGARRADATILKDRLFLLGRDNPTTMKLEFNSERENSVTLFCGAWCDQDAKFELFNFSVKEKE